MTEIIRYFQELTALQIIGLCALPFALWATVHIIRGPVRGKSPNYTNSEWGEIQRRIIRMCEDWRQEEYRKHSEGYRKAHEND